jgi:hypothetical protein
LSVCGSFHDCDGKKRHDTVNCYVYHIDPMNKNCVGKALVQPLTMIDAVGARWNHARYALRGSLVFDASILL